MVRSEVAVGTARLASMFSAMRRAPPRMGWAMSPGRMAATATARGFWAARRRKPSVRATAVLRVREGWSRRGSRRGGGASAGRPVILSKYSLQLDVHGRPVLPILLEQVEGECVIAAEVVDEGVQEGVVGRGRHSIFESISFDP